MVGCSSSTSSAVMILRNSLKRSAGDDSAQVARRCVAPHFQRHFHHRRPFQQRYIASRALSPATAASITRLSPKRQRPRPEHRRRVVVTGMGVICPIGNTLKESWNNLMSYDKDNKCNSDRSNGMSCIGVTTLEEALIEQHRQGFIASDEYLQKELNIASKLPCQVAAPVRNLRRRYEQLVEELEIQQEQSKGIEDNGSKKATLTYDPKRTSRSVQFALMAGTEAMKQSGLLQWLQDGKNDLQQLDHRFGVCIGTGMSSVREITHSYDHLSSSSSSKRSNKLSPQFIPKVLANSPSARLSLMFGLRGPTTSPSTACAASAHAIGEAFRQIQYGTCDVMLAGGTEASIEPLGLAGFSSLRALSTKFNDEPKLSSRPFDSKRDGFVMGEGSAVLVLEELENVRKRGATDKILAELRGYGSSSDAFHITAPDEDGEGAYRSMMMALADDMYFDDTSHSDDDAVIYVNAHATSTPKGDEIEVKAIERVFNDLRDSSDRRDEGDGSSATPTSPNQVLVSSTKGATGHLLGAAGALEAAFTVMSLVDQRIPATANLDALDSHAVNLDKDDEDYDGDDDIDAVPKTNTSSSKPSSSAKVRISHVTGSPKVMNCTSLPTEQSEGSNRQSLRYAMTNSFGFGGTNASLLFSSWRDDDK